MQLKNGSLFLFRLFGVNVFVHWSWALVAAFEMWRNTTPAAGEIAARHSLIFYIAQYLCLFLIVLIHEFGHALACKSVGGKAERIMLWPLGGIAYVQPPPRPGATLWSIAAGPLVNVILLPVTIIPALAMGFLHGADSSLANFLGELAVINIVLLVFNILPIYPLDGGQILRSLIWFISDRGTSLLIAAWIGIGGAAMLAAVALFTGQTFLAFLVAYMGYRSFVAIKVGSALRAIEKAPRRGDAICPACAEHPPVGLWWKCPCGNRFDTFAADAQCPACGKQFLITACPLCNKSSPRPLWHSSTGFTVAATAPVAVGVSAPENNS